MARKQSYSNKKIKKQINKIISLVLALIISALVAKLAVVNQKTVPYIGQAAGNIIKVADGDTLTILTDDSKEMKLRLYGIDAPEKNQEFGPNSQKFLASLVKGKHITADIIDIDQYGRGVAKIILNEEVVNQTMVLEGYAWVYTQYCKIPECKEWKAQQQNARNAKKGLWKTKNPTPPWKWRKENK